MAKKETLPEKQARLKAIAIAAAESVYHYKLIARSINVDQDTLKKYRDEDSEFSDELEQGRFRFLQRHIKRAKDEFLLERLEPELFKQRSESDLFVKELPKPILGGNSVSGNESTTQTPSS